jgi:hypothetical protein
MHSGHEQAHGKKLQSAVTPDGLFACMPAGAVNSNHHDSFMLNQSKSLHRLQI